jgi:hypothetical protein
MQIMRHRRGGILCLLYKSERDLTPTHNYLTPPHSYSMYLNDTLYLLRLAPISAVEGTLPEILFLRCLQGILKNACQVHIRYHRKQQKIIIDNEASTTGFTKTQPTLDSNSHKPLFQEIPQPFAFTLHVSVPLEKKRSISLLLKE